jgi:TolA-binding protein
MLRETMDCQRIADDELVEKYLNGRLDPALQDELEIHLLSCPHCLAQAEELKTIRAGLATAPQRTPGVKAKFWNSGWGRIAVAAAVLILVATWIYLFRQNSRKPAQTANTPVEAPANTPVAPKPRNDAGSEHASDHPAQKPEKKNPRPETKPDRDAQEAQGPKIAPETKIAINQPTPAPSASTSVNARKEQSSGMSEEDAVELYRLAAVQAPPYTFNQPGGSTGPGIEPGTKPSSSFSSMTGPGSAFFQQAMLAYVKGQYGDAAQLLEKTVQSQPSAVPANFYLGVCRLLQGHPVESVAPLKEVLAAPASSFTQSAHFYLAKAYLQMSRLEDAEREMQSAAALPGNLTAESQSLAARIHTLRDHASR